MGLNLKTECPVACYGNFLPKVLVLTQGAVHSRVCCRAFLGMACKVLWLVTWSHDVPRSCELKQQRLERLSWNDSQMQAHH